MTRMISQQAADEAIQDIVVAYINAIDANIKDESLAIKVKEDATANILEKVLKLLKEVQMNSGAQELFGPGFF